MDINVYDNIVSSERATINKIENFSEFLRGYPFNETILTNVSVTEFENGVEQRRDNWGKTKHQFEINTPVLTKDELLEYIAFYEDRVGQSEPFLFTNPVTGITYNVRFLEGEFSYERRFYNTYFATFTLIEVF